MRIWKPLLLVLALFVAVGLACTRSASQGMPATPTFQVYLATPAGQAVITGQTPRAPEQMSTPMPQTPMAEEATPTPLPTQPPTPTSVPPTPTPVLTQPAGPTPTPLNLRVPEKYVLKYGEFPYCIARRFNINPDDLLRANGLPKGARPPAGTVLVIPQNARPWPESAPRALRPHPTTYTTRAGDTVYRIACLFGDVWPEQIAQANGIPLADMDKPLPPGRELRIP